MKVSELFKKRMVFSFEVFPPKTEKGLEGLCGKGKVLDELGKMKPDYISCTYGAGGSNAGYNLDVLKAIKARDIIPVTHFTCIGNTKADMKKALDERLAAGVDHILALRGDLPLGWTGTGGDLHYATDLVKFIRDTYGEKFTIAVAGSPEGHIQCRSLDADISFLKQKQDNGADYIMTQLCFDMDAFRRWVDKIRAAGITMPIDVGIMPVVDARATMNMALSRNGCVMPRALCELISKYWIFPDPFSPKDASGNYIDKEAEKKMADFRKYGLEYTVGMIDEYRVAGIGGIHLYALNTSKTMFELVKASGIWPHTGE